MLDAPTLLLFLGATLALNLTPGPDMLYVATRSAAEGRQAGLVSALGIAGGTVFHTLVVALGLSSFLLAVPLAYDIVRWLGAGYLFALGFRALARRQQGPAEAPALVRASPWRIFRQGVVTNALNPKVALFFLAFLPQFASPSRGSVSAQLLLLGLLFNVSGTLVNVLVALAASGASHWGRRRARGSAVLARLTGLVFVGLGARLLLEPRP